MRWVGGDGNPLDANSWQRGRWWSLRQLAVWSQLAGVVYGRWRCCTSVLYALGLSSRRIGNC
jgi:hypothetical protein